MARMHSTSQKKNITMPGMTYPATVLDLVAMGASYPRTRDLFGDPRRAPAGELAALDVALATGDLAGAYGALISLAAEGLG